MNIFRRIYRRLHPVTYTLEQLSDMKIEALRAAGAEIGDNIDIINSEIDIIGGGNLLSIGSNVTITNARILTHDASTKKFIGYTRIGRVSIGSDVFIGAGAIILPETTIGNRVIIGAGCVVAKDIPDNSVVVGNPCRIISSVDAYIAAQKAALESEQIRGEKEELTTGKFIQ